MTDQPSKPSWSRCRWAGASSVQSSACWPCPTPDQGSTWSRSGLLPPPSPYLLAHVCHPISSVVCNEHIAVAESGVWHCIPCMFPSSSGLDDQLADPARRGVHAQPPVDLPLPGLGLRRLARVQHASVRLAEDRGHSPLARQATAQRRPAGAPTGTGGPRCARACGGGSGAVPVRSRGSGGRPPGRSASRRCATASRRPSRRCWCAGRGPRDGSPRCPPAAAASRPPPSRCGPCRPPARRSRRAGRRTDGGPAAVRCARRPAPPSPAPAPPAAREAAGVQHQAQRERRIVVALLPGMAAAGQRLPVRRALEARVGQVEQVGGALRTGQAQLLEQGRRTELPHGPQGDVLDADRARADQLQGVDVDPRPGPPGPRGRRRPAPAGRRCAGPRPRPRGSRPRTRGTAGGGGEDALDAGAQRRPVPARQGEVTAEVAQGALAHPGAAADEAVGEVGLLAPGAGASGGPADEQAPMEAGPGTGVRELQVVVALHLGFQGGWPLQANDLQRKTRRIRPKSLLAWRTWARA